jgi:hypothetical protein
MHVGRGHIWRIACLLAFALSNVAAAQTSPSIPQSAITASQLNDTQRGQIDEFVGYWCDRLGGEDAAAVADARDNLSKHFRIYPASDTFRSYFSRRCVPRLEEIIEAEDPPLSVVNALIVLPFLGTEDAMETLLERTTPANEDRAYVRMRAAVGCQVLLASGLLPERKLNGYLRELRDAAMNEPHAWVLRHQLDAIAEVNSPEAREQFVATLDRLVDRMADDEEGPCDLLPAYRQGIFNLQRSYLVLAGDEQRRLGAQLGPILGRFLEIAATHWENAQAEQPRTYAAAVKTTETLLGVVDGQVRGPQGVPATDVAGAWDTGDQARYSADVATWAGILGSAPYRR